MNISKYQQQGLLHFIIYYVISLNNKSISVQARIYIVLKALMYSSSKVNVSVQKL